VISLLAGTVFRELVAVSVLVCVWHHKPHKWPERKGTTKGTTSQTTRKDVEIMPKNGKVLQDELVVTSLPKQKTKSNELLFHTHGLCTNSSLDLRHFTKRNFTKMTKIGKTLLMHFDALSRRVFESTHATPLPTI
jgi:hypothetical protein